MTGPGPIERAFTEVFGSDNTSGKAIVRAIDYELAALHQRIDKMEADNANMDGLRAMDDAIARERDAQEQAGTVFWAPVTEDDPPADGSKMYLLAVPVGALAHVSEFCICTRRADGAFIHIDGPVWPTHFAWLKGPER